jgi:hypothetical protein
MRTGSLRRSTIRPHAREALIHLMGGAWQRRITRWDGDDMAELHNLKWML